LLFCHYLFDVLLLLSRFCDTGTTHPFDVVHLQYQQKNLKNQRNALTH